MDSLGRLNKVEVAAEVKSVKMPTRIVLNQSDPEVLFLQAADLGAPPLLSIPLARREAVATSPSAVAKVISST